MRKLTGHAALVATITLTTAGSILAQGSERWKTDFSRRSVPANEIVSGGPSKDGIPAIDHPKFVSVKAAGRWLADPEPVVVVETGRTARAYPLQILIWHEIVNDQIGDKPVTVTFCPLCNTAIAFDRRVGDRILDFGVSGRLRNSDMVMYDRQTETWWQQATGEGIVGELTGTRLTRIGAPLVSWRTFRETWPDGEVLSRETGHDRPYGRNPYTDYDRPSGKPIPGFVSATPDPRLPAMERVVAIAIGAGGVAHSFTGLAKDSVRHDTVNGTSLVIFWAPGTASALDAQSIARGRDVGSTGVFETKLGNRDLHFSPHGPGTFRDRETNSTWSILGRAVAGELAGQQLTPITHGNHFWFAWVAFRPDTRLVQ